MGYNTTVVFMNDSIDVIKNDPKFGEKLYKAILMVQRGQPVDVMATDGKFVCPNAATVIESHHADYDVLVKVGGNTGTVVNEYHTGD